ncbi:MAG: agmatinase [Clostridia bacterium]|nr:agmatinase [Clostridia bacterium]
MFVPRGRFLGCTAAYEAARGVLFGAPLDVTVTFRPGSRVAPERVREVSDVLETYSLALDADLADRPVCDAGDVAVVPGNAVRSLERIEAAAAGVLADGKIPFVVGGEHLITLALVRAAARVWPDLVVVQMDAHADLRDEYEGERLSHATVMRRVAEELGGGRLYQFGVRSAVPEELAFARTATHLHPHEVLAPLRDTIPSLAGRPVYVTVDVDVCDPAFAPGTGTPEPGGIASGELLAALYALCGCQVVGFDLVEVCPAQDPTERTAVLAAKILREAMLCFAR